jgi:hypothetical protein
MLGLIAASLSLPQPAVRSGRSPADGASASATLYVRNGICAGVSARVAAGTATSPVFTSHLLCRPGQCSLTPSSGISNRITYFIV